MAVSERLLPLLRPANRIEERHKRFEFVCCEAEAFELRMSDSGRWGRVVVRKHVLNGVERSRMHEWWTGCCTAQRGCLEGAFKFFPFGLDERQLHALL